MAKKQKKEEYVELNGVLGNAFDYHVYHMQFTDYLIAWILGFVLAMVVILIFFGSVIFGAREGPRRRGALSCGSRARGPRRPRRRAAPTRPARAGP